MMITHFIFSYTSPLNILIDISMYYNQNWDADIIPFP